MPIPFRRHPAGSWSKSFVVAPLRPGRDWGLGTGCTECDFLAPRIFTPLTTSATSPRASCIARTPNEKIRSMSPRESCWLMSSVKLCRKIPGDISVGAGKSTSSARVRHQASWISIRRRSACRRWQLLNRVDQRVTRQLGVECQDVGQPSGQRRADRGAWRVADSDGDRLRPSTLRSPLATFRPLTPELRTAFLRAPSGSGDFHAGPLHLAQPVAEKRFADGQRPGRIAPDVVVRAQGGQ